MLINMSNLTLVYGMFLIYTHCISWHVMRRGSRIVTDKSWVRRLFPVLRQEFVASSVLSAIKDGREQLILPRTLSMVSALLHLLPTPLYDVIVSMAGGSHGMNGFRRN